MWPPVRALQSIRLVADWSPRPAYPQSAASEQVEAASQREAVTVRVVAQSLQPVARVVAVRMVEVRMVEVRMVAVWE